MSPRLGSNRIWWTLAASGLLCGVWASVGRADAVSLRNGVQVEGRVGKIASIYQPPNPAAAETTATPIVFTDDGLRRTYFPRTLVRDDGYAVRNPAQEKIRIAKRVAVSNKRIGTVGPVIRITPFDEYGNRSYTMRAPAGALTVIQGMTEITPIYTKVEGLVVEQSYVWDMRVATNSIPRDTLTAVVRRAIDPKNANQRLQIVRLYTQAERYEDARQELAACILDFPELADLKKLEQELTQLAAGRLLREVELRRDVGQHQHANYLLEELQKLGPMHLSAEASVRIRDLLAEYAEQFKLGQQTIKQMKEFHAKASGDKLRMKLQPTVDEIERNMNFNTLARMADFVRLADDDKMTPEQKLALAISGWVLGSGGGTDNLAVAMSAVEVRDLVREYLRTKQPADREMILSQLTSLEGASAANVAKILANMKPPLDPPQTDDQESRPGYYEVSIPGTTEQAEFTYHVQLPPQYDPYRRYPCVVTLGGTGLKAKDQLQWWTGVYDAQRGIHTGQAPRHGYVVIAVDWVADRQRSYEFSAREHAAVLYSLRDACRRFSIDTDRVFLSGHSTGGDAAWDIGLAHPDLWAGVIPIVAGTDKFIGRYSDNVKYVPFYFVSGELDGDKMSRNGPQFDRYMQYGANDVMIVDFQGRGHEHFQEELPRIIEWMNVHRRDFFVKNWKVQSMRPWDNFFWFAEFNNFPAKTMASPASWPPPKGTAAAKLEGRVTDNNGVVIDSHGAKMTVWLAPEFIDFTRKVSINGKSRTVNPSLETLLEDVRTRGDRLHPFWAKVEP